MDNKQYRNREWLYKKYWKEDLSVEQIANICKISNEGLRKWMKKYYISRRSHSEANHLRRGNSCKLSKKAIEWINGELLGDGCLVSQYQYSARFVYGSKYLEYIEYIKNTLDSFGINITGKIYKKQDKKRGNISYGYTSRAYEELAPIHKQWYPNGKKIVPKNIKLTPLTLRQHYIGDGSLNHKKHNKPYVILSTCGFTIPDVEWLVKYLFRLGFKAIRWPSRNIIGISTYSTKDFINYIGECPVKCYQYKWAY